MILSKLLADTQRSGKLIRVALVGAGQMGEGLVCQMELMQGMQAVAVADVQPGRAAAAFRSANLAETQIITTDDLALAAQAIDEGKRVAMSDARKLCALPNIDIIVEATGVPEIGARVAWDAILARKHILQMNVETDATVGYLLRRNAPSTRAPAVRSKAMSNIFMSPSSWRSQSMGCRITRNGGSSRLQGSGYSTSYSKF